jgi:hypothetical protein
MKKEQYLQLINNAHIEAEEKEYLSAILQLIGDVQEIPSDMQLRLEDIFIAETSRLDKEEQTLEAELRESQAVLGQKKRDLPGKLDAIDRQALEQVEQLEREASEKMDQIDKEELHTASAQKQTVDMQRYQEILESLKKKK